MAQVALGSEIRQGAVTMTRKNADGKAENLGEVVTGIVLKRMGANTKTTIDAVDARIERIQRGAARRCPLRGVLRSGGSDQEKFLTPYQRR